MPQLKQITVYTVGELSEKARDKAHCDFLSCCGTDLDSALEWQKQRLEKAGFTIRSLDYSVGGSCDYASMIGSYYYRKGWKKAYVTDYGKACPLLPIMLRLQGLMSKVFYDFSLTLSCTRYGTQLLDYDCIGDVYAYRHTELSRDMQKDMLECIQDINHVVLSDLKSDYDSEVSTEYFVDMCESNEWLFLESGELYHG